MIGVTLFGLIFTPVFYVVTRWSGARASRRTAIPVATMAE
jgi:HAE1 family hydrophobic/amphiphilic exporter-1